jgi:hypothetical protein
LGLESGRQGQGKLATFPKRNCYLISSARVSVLEYQGKAYPTRGQMIIPSTHTIQYDPKVFQCPAIFNPERFIDPKSVPLNAWRPFERGPRACMGRELAMQELRIILLLTVRSFEFGCVGMQPRTTPRVSYTDLDLRLGDLAFQESAFSAKPRGGTMMKVECSSGSSNY